MQSSARKYGRDVHDQHLDDLQFLVFLVLHRPDYRNIRPYFACDCFGERGFARSIFGLRFRGYQYGCNLEGEQH